MTVFSAQASNLINCQGKVADPETGKKLAFVVRIDQKHGKYTSDVWMSGMPEHLKCNQVVEKQLTPNEIQTNEVLQMLAKTALVELTQIGSAKSFEIGVCDDGCEAMAVQFFDSKNGLLGASALLGWGVPLHCE